MLMFTLGPVLMHEYTKEVAKEQIPYFRTNQFSDVVKRTTKMFNEAICAGENDETIFFTSSGTGAMEATVINALTQDTKVLIINGGVFGERWKILCEMHKIPHDVLDVPFESDLTSDMLAKFSRKGYFALLVNIHETGVGKLYSGKLLSDFCRQENMYFFVDAISSAFADSFNVSNLNIDIAITSSQKALALAPGLAIVTVSAKFYADVISKKEYKNMYFDFNDYVKNAKRGQTPFTPAIGIVYQLQNRLEKILEQGVDNVVKQTHTLAECFRKEAVKRLPAKICDFTLSNAMTPLMFEGINAKQLILKLYENHNIAVNISQLQYADKMVRIGHMGALNEGHYDRLITAIETELKNT